MFLLKPGLVSETKITKTPTSLEVALERQRGCGLHLSMGWGAVLKPGIGKNRSMESRVVADQPLTWQFFCWETLKFGRLMMVLLASELLWHWLNASFRWVSAAQAHDEAFWRPFTARVEVWSVALQLSVVWCKNYGTFLYCLNLFETTDFLSMPQLPQRTCK